jgi:hypothetical protein
MVVPVSSAINRSGNVMDRWSAFRTSGQVGSASRSAWLSSKKGAETLTTKASFLSFGR